MNSQEWMSLIGQMRSSIALWAVKIEYCWLGCLLSSQDWVLPFGSRQGVVYYGWSIVGLEVGVMGCCHLVCGDGALLPGKSVWGVVIIRMGCCGESSLIMPSWVKSELISDLSTNHVTQVHNTGVDNMGYCHLG